MRLSKIILGTRLEVINDWAFVPNSVLKCILSLCLQLVFVILVFYKSREPFGNNTGQILDCGKLFLCAFE